MIEQCHQLIDYFNRTLSQEEQQQFENHLTDCPSCQEELLELQLLTEDLPYLSEEIDVPSDMKSRIFATIDELATPVNSPETIVPTPLETSERPKQKRFNFAIPSLAAALFASIVTNAYLLNETNKEPEIAMSDVELIAQTTLASTVDDENATAVAMLLSNKGEELLIVDSTNLPALADGELYQVWVIEGEKPYPAGVLDSTKGSVSHSLKDLTGKWDTIAITIEKEPDLPAPEGSLVLAGGI
ncbi:anti-sigma factor [Sporosarcina sp. Sa2YVA2]|uniref:Anti-sigma-W factor RsiW n=1 Tax=Sporosarcina quadrami TaxID=2762234 RepID=A0ABR8U9Y7_9BACL|nr:anti-sigma factor [Sporosarcina quadrami]MBD7984850.1 anti-sigma factor [Sporosarcina quadrami]